MSNKFYIEEQYKERFYQLPKVFFTNTKYKKFFEVFKKEIGKD